MQPKTIVLGVRDDKYQSRNRQGSFPVTSNLTIEHILKQGERLLKEYISERRGSIGYVTNVQLSFSGLERAEKGQQGIANFLGTGLNAGESSAAVSEVSRTISGKRKASEEIVDLTLEDENEIEVTSLSSDDLIEIRPTGPTYKCSRCEAVMSIKTTDDEDVEIARRQIEYTHARYHATQDQLIAEPRKNRTESRLLTDLPDKEKSGSTAKKLVTKSKKRKGQQQLKSFFGK